MTIDQQALLATLAVELDEARADLERLGTALCANPTVAMAHVGELQSLDHIGQRCAAIATILRSSDMHSAGQAAPLETIADRIGSLPQ